MSTLMGLNPYSAYLLPTIEREQPITVRALGRLTGHAQDRTESTVADMARAGLVRYIRDQDRYLVVLAGWTEDLPFILGKIAGRCRPTADGCLEWTTYVDPVRGPMLGVNRRPQMVRRIMYETFRGRLGYGQTVAVTCTNEDCIDPEHLEARSRAHKLRGRPLTVEHRQKTALTKRARSRLSDAAADEIRNSTETAKVLAERHGICRATAAHIKSGRQRLPIDGPYTELLWRANVRKS